MYKSGFGSPHAARAAAPAALSTESKGMYLFCQNNI
jgi:hypothetical protein